MKKNIFLLACFTTALLLSVCLPAQAQVNKSAKAILDGKTFYVELAEKGKKPYTKDTLTFAKGRFHSSECDQYGFSKGTYTTTTNGSAVNFETTTTSVKEGKLIWKGTVTGNDIAIDYVWEKKGQPTSYYTAKGSLAKK